MTTPRVTVPVEPTEAMLEAAENTGMTMAGSDMSSPDMTRYIWSAMLTAAPVREEGGAVPYSLNDLCQEVRRRYPDAFNGNDPIAAHPPSLKNATDLFLAVCFAALATREVSPAEAGEERRVLELIADGWEVIESSGPMGEMTLQAPDEWDGPETEVVFSFHALRTQPPAREDAQPVAWRVEEFNHAGLSRRVHAVIGPKPYAGERGPDRIEVQPLYTHPAPDALREEVERLRAALNTPEVDDFAKAVVLEAQHQRERWPSEHDAGKAPLDWFWLVGYLAQKAATAQMAGDDYKAKHHTISTAAALANWHAAISGEHTSMRPGIEPPATEAVALQAEQGAK